MQGEDSNQLGHQPNQVIIFALHAKCRLYMLTARSGHFVVITFSNLLPHTG